MSGGHRGALSKPYRQNGWPPSPYSAKTRAYFRYKQIPFEEHHPSARQLYGPIKKAVGAMIMPTVVTPEGRWLQDTSEIIDELERRFPEPAIVPTTPTQRVAAYLLELHGDEWLPIVAMHTRWNYEANRRFAESEFGRYGFSMLPNAVSRRLAAPIAKKMRSYRPVLGITDATVPGIESFAKDLIARLDAHLAVHPFLFGTRPSIADFALYGPLWAHVFRDPATTHWYDDAPHVRSWFGRLDTPSSDRGEFLADDEVPESLDTIFATLFEEQMRFVRDLVTAVARYCDEHPDAHRVPRSLGEHQVRIGGHEGTRKLITFSQWMAQRPIETYHQLGDEDRANVDRWLDRVGGEDAMQIEIAHPFERVDFKMRLRR